MCREREGEDRVQCEEIVGGTAREVSVERGDEGNEGGEEKRDRETEGKREGPGPSAPGRHAAPPPKECLGGAAPGGKCPPELLPECPLVDSPYQLSVAPGPPPLADDDEGIELPCVDGRLARRAWRCTTRTPSPDEAGTGPTSDSETPRRGARGEGGLAKGLLDAEDCWLTGDEPFEVEVEAMPEGGRRASGSVE